MYQGRLFATPSGPSPNAGILNFITCSDGPCTGIRNGVYFDYVSADAKESDTPDSCCNIDGLDPNGFSPYLYFYNPQLANGSASTRNTSWLGDLGLIFNNGSYFPGTGLTCNRTLPKYKCVLGTIVSAWQIRVYMTIVIKLLQLGSQAQVAAGPLYPNQLT